MNLTFDHLVHFTRSPEAAMEGMEELGFHAVYGGTHTIWGTYNTLSFFGLSYIEWIGIKDEAVAKHVTDNNLIKQIVKEQGQGDHLVTFAIRTNDMQQLVAHLNRHGLHVVGPVEGSRLKEDGTLLQWKMLFIDGEEHPYPFFIEWGKTDDERIEEMKDVQNDSTYQMDAVYLAVRNLHETANWFAEIFELERSEVYEDDDLQATCQRLFLSGGAIVICQPYADDGVTFDALNESGPHPFMLSITSSGKEQQQRIIAGVPYLLPVTTEG